MGIVINRGAGRAPEAGGREHSRAGQEKFFTERPVRIAAGPASAYIPGLGAAVGVPAGQPLRAAAEFPCGQLPVIFPGSSR
jgi:hypothetical protein